MPKYWSTPIYELQARGGKTIRIDVTTSVSPGLSANKVVVDQVIPFLKKKRVGSVLDFGAGALRHTLPLLEAGFQVTAVEFETAFARPRCRHALALARNHPNFSALVWPGDFIQDRRKFDAALLVYVLQVMPMAKERQAVLKHIYRKLNRDGYLFYASRYGQVAQADRKHCIRDGYFRWPTRKFQTFYREFKTEETHALFAKHRYKYIRYLSQRGTDQMFLYAKGKGTWI